MITDTTNTVVPLTDDHSLQLSINPLNKYKPYWTNRSHYFSNQTHIPHSIHLLSSNCNPSTANCPIVSCSSDSNTSAYILTTNQQNSTTITNRTNDSGNILPTAISNLQKPSTTIEERNFLNSSNFTTLNLPNMWNYSTFLHHFSVPYPSLVTHNPPYI